MCNSYFNNYNIKIIKNYNYFSYILIFNNILIIEYEFKSESIINPIS